MRKITLLVIHCTASRSDRTLSPQDLLKLHQARGFKQCGYHFYITTDGQCHRMRPEEMAGAHARGYNTHSIGIAYEGGLDPAGCPADTRTAEQKKALRQLLKQLLLKFPGSRIVGHRDLSPDLNNNGTIEPAEYIKLCPCFNAIPEYARLANELNQPLRLSTPAKHTYPEPGPDKALTSPPNQSTHNPMKKVWTGLLCVLRFIFTNETFQRLMKHIFSRK